MVTVEVRAILSVEQVSALHRVLDRQLKAIQYIEEREKQNLAPQIKQGKQAIEQFLPALERAMRLAKATEDVQDS